ncbi:hypothetical protein GA0070609_5846 [Micromonospora echinaurantiaca]|uniref:Uncharacterized protein n=1 Tax=Micromonospora echinaurantiaca TaxID=47857 RepID=A0A1C5K9J4_9ACTN|nr:hypothetical protein GA0070609_5846 [Micromonospora echinaurantiaca]
MIGFCSFRRDNSSSSSHLCKLWRTGVRAGQTGYPPVVSLWRTRGTTRVLVHRPPGPPGCPRLSTGCPPVIHRLSPQGCGPAETARPASSPEPSTARPQADRPLGTTAPLSPGVHSVVPRVSPQAVGNRLRTERGCPPTVDNELWTTRRSGGRSRLRCCGLDLVEGQVPGAVDRPAARMNDPAWCPSARWSPQTRRAVGSERACAGRLRRQRTGRPEVPRVAVALWADPPWCPEGRRGGRVGHGNARPASWPGAVTSRAYATTGSVRRVRRRAAT